MAELRLGSGILRIHGPVFCFPFVVTPIYGGFAYLVPPRWVLGVDAPLPRKSPRGPTVSHGTLRSDKMAELRLESVTLGIPGPAFCFPFVVIPSTVDSRI